MALIEREKHIKLLPLHIKIEEGLHKRLGEYAAFTDSSFDHIIGQALDYVISKDKDFAATSGNGTLILEVPTPRKKRSQAKAAAE